MALGTVYVRNADSEDLYVTIKDLNTAGNDILWDKKRLNEDDTQALTCEIDGDYQAHLEWTAVSTNNSSVTHSDTDKVDEGNTLEVYAN